MKTRKTAPVLRETRNSLQHNALTGIPVKRLKIQNKSSCNTLQPVFGNTNLTMTCIDSLNSHHDNSIIPLQTVTHTPVLNNTTNQQYETEFSSSDESDDGNDENNDSFDQNHENKLTNILINQQIANGRAQNYITPQKIDTDVNDIQINTKRFYTQHKHNIVGQCYSNELQLYTRTQLFRGLKIITNEHLIEDGTLMKKLLSIVHFNENNKDQNRDAYINACKYIVREALNSKRNHVKRIILNELMSK
jgi:hypothetical protein